MLFSVLAFGACTWLGIIGAKLLPAIFIKLAPVRKPKPAAGTPAGATAATEEIPRAAAE
jgi:hypothetical protein